MNRPKKVQDILKNIYSEKEVEEWWERKHSELGGRTPSEAWLNQDRQAVLALAIATEESIYFLKTHLY